VAPMQPLVRKLYRQLIWAGREYPGGLDIVRRKTKQAFFANKDAKWPDEVKPLILQGKWWTRELEVIAGIAKYRHLRRAYGDENERDRMAHLEEAAELLKDRKAYHESVEREKTEKETERRKNLSLEKEE